MLLEQGAIFRNMLQTNSYTGRTQFRMQLIKDGYPVKGFGLATKSELDFCLSPLNGSTVSEKWGLRSYPHNWPAITQDTFDYF